MVGPGATPSARALEVEPVRHSLVLAWSDRGREVETSDRSACTSQADGSKVVDLSQSATLAGGLVARRLGDPPIDERGGYTPAWSPDGEHIVFSAPGLSIMDPDGSDARAFPSLGVGETALADWTD